MRDCKQEPVDNVFTMDSMLKVIRAIGAILGIVAIVIGLVFATRLFTSVLAALRSPESYQAYIAMWTDAVGGEELSVVIAGQTYRCANVIAIMILGFGVTILACIAMGLMQMGAKTISCTLGDKEAVKRILVHALGQTAKRKPNKSVRAAAENIEAGR